MKIELINHLIAKNNTFNKKIMRRPIMSKKIISKCYNKAKTIYIIYIQPLLIKGKENVECPYCGWK